MSKFRKKPVVIEALQWDGTDNGVDAVLDWMMELGYGGEAGGHGSDAPNWDDGGDFYIVTLEGKMHASIGDWIIRGTQGEFYPCKPAAFEDTFEPADSAHLIAVPHGHSAFVYPIPAITDSATDDGATIIDQIAYLEAGPLRRGAGPHVADLIDRDEAPDEDG